jgi:hypothetical protein
VKARLTIADLSPRHQAEVMRQLDGGKPVGIARAEAVRAVEIVGVTKRLRQSSKGPNKTEAAFSAWLKANLHGAIVSEQAITLRIGNGVRFTPDFITVQHDIFDKARFKVCAWETKGHMRDDAAVKLKVAAAQYPWIKFVLVTAADRARTRWHMEEVKP